MPKGNNGNIPLFLPVGTSRFGKNKYLEKVEELNHSILKSCNIIMSGYTYHKIYRVDSHKKREIDHYC